MGATTVLRYRLIEKECAVNPGSMRYVITGTQRLPELGQALEHGLQVDITVAEPHMVAKCLQMVDDNPTLCGFLFECTELGPFSNAVRCATGELFRVAISSCQI